MRAGFTVKVCQGMFDSFWAWNALTDEVLIDATRLPQIKGTFVFMFPTIVSLFIHLKLVRHG